MTLLEINLPEALMGFQVLAVDEGRYNLLSSEWMPDRGVLRAELVADQEHHRLYVRVDVDDVEWDCSCGDLLCTAIATAITGFDAVRQRSSNQSAVESGSMARLFYRLWNKTGQLMAQTLVGSEPNMNLPVLEPARGLGKIQPRFVTATDRPILAHLAANAGQVLDQDCVDALSRSGRAYWQKLSGKALSRSETRSIGLSWQLLPNGAQQLAPELPPGYQLMARSPLCLLELSSQKPCFDQRPAGSFARELTAPISLDQIAERWRELGTTDLPTPFIPSEYADTHTTPGVHLRLRHAADYAAATLNFCYGSLTINADESADPLVERCGATAVLHARNREFEAAAIDQLLTGGWRHGSGEWQLPGNPAVLAHFMLERLPKLEAMAWAIEFGVGCPRIDFVTTDKLRLEIAAGAGALRYPGEPVNLLEVPTPPVRSGQHLLLCTGEGRVLAIDAELFTDIQLALAVSGEVSPAQLAALPVQVESEQDLPLQSLVALSDTTTALPNGLRADLRPYQQTGFQWLWRLYQAGFGALLADDMGLGKTLQALVLISKVMESDPDAGPCLVVAPVSILDNWRSEAARFTPGLQLDLYHGSSRSDRDWCGVDVVLTTYGLLRQEHERFASQPWSIAILDEAQAIKNPRSRTARAARALDSRFRLCLSGTPMENHLGELWSLFAFAEPGLLGAARAFDETFRKTIEAGDQDLQTALARRIGPFMLRRTREQVLAELPTLIETELRVELGEEQRALYESVRAAGIADLQALDAATGEFARRGNVLKIITRLRQACCSPTLLPEDFPLRSAPSAKLQAAEEMLSELLAEQRNVLVFSQFRGMLDELRDSLIKSGVNSLLLTGDTVNRAEVIRQFQDGAAPVFLISLRAGGVGLNLVRADTVILLDPWWNPAVEQQAAARAHRMGQKNTVFLYRLIAADTIEDAMQRLKADKRQISDDLTQAVATLDWADPALLTELLNAD